MSPRALRPAPLAHRRRRAQGTARHAARPAHAAGDVASGPGRRPAGADAHVHGHRRPDRQGARIEAAGGRPGACARAGRVPGAPAGHADRCSGRLRGEGPRRRARRRARGRRQFRKRRGRRQGGQGAAGLRPLARPGATFDPRGRGAAARLQPAMGIATTAVARRRAHGRQSARRRRHRPRDTSAKRRLPAVLPRLLRTFRRRDGRDGDRVGRHRRRTREAVAGTAADDTRAPAGTGHRQVAGRRRRSMP